MLSQDTHPAAEARGATSKEEPPSILDLSRTSKSHESTRGTDTALMHPVL